MNRKHLLTLLTGSTLVLGAAAAQESGYGDFDTDGDGQVDATEFNDAYANGLYDTFNADGNDYVDQNEFSGGVYTLFDADGDGTLSEDEYSAGVNTLYGGDYGGAYSDFDADGDGTLTQEEFTQTYDPSGLLGTFDADGNGEVAEGEFNEGVFGVADANDDGVFTEDEYGDASLLFETGEGAAPGGGVVRAPSAFDAEDYRAFGDAQVGVYEPYEVAAGGAISLAFSTPNEQNVDFNVTGPDGYREDFEVGGFGFEFGSDVRVVEGLAPGVYSVAATDDNLQLIETKVEVREGELVPLTFNMQRLEDFDYTLADYEAYGVAEVGAYEPIDVADYGNLIVDIRLGDRDTVAEVVPKVNVTGPEDYRREFEGDDNVLRTLVAGPYSVAATAPGYRMTEGKVDVQNGQAAQVTLTLEPLGGSGDGGN